MNGAQVAEAEILSVASEMGVRLGQAEARQLAGFANLLMRWNRTYNLTSIDRPVDVVRLHIADSLTLVKSMSSVSVTAGLVLDVGSGGGLPAIPLAVMRPDLIITMVDSARKKVLFLRQAILETGLANASAVHARVESLVMQADVITSRAFAALPEMVSMTETCLKPGGRWAAMKGRIPEEEIGQLPDYVEVEKILPVELPGGSSERHLIVLKRREDA